MFLAAFTSALQAKPQAVHRKPAWLSRDSGSTCLHAEQRWLVNAGLIFSTRPGALFPEEVKRRFLPGLNAGASTPRSRRAAFAGSVT